MKYMIFFSIFSLFFLSIWRAEAKEDEDYYKCVDAINRAVKYCHVEGYSLEECRAAGKNIDRYCRSDRSYP